MQYPEVPRDASVAALIIRVFKLTVLVWSSISLRTRNLKFVQVRLLVCMYFLEYFYK